MSSYSDPNNAVAGEGPVLTSREGRVLLITLNRPGAGNSINGALSTALAEAIATLDSDPELTVAVLAGAGGQFSAGMDLKAFAAGEDIKAALKFMRRGASKPVIAAVERYALGGGLELALACDLIVAETNAKFGLPEVRVGLFAGAGGLLRLPSRIGPARAMELALTGRSISAETAAEYGLVARVAAVGATVAAAQEIAAEIAANAPLAVQASRDLIKATQGVTEREYWDLQEPYRASVFGSQDAKEGPRAFAEKRAPVWQGC